MAGVSLLTLLDDIASVLDDVSLAVKKTAGVLGDDLALNAQQVSGVKADRELPVVWAVFKGSVRNKLILVPAALLLSVYAPILIVPLMLIGGLYLCYEGFEKVFHTLFKHDEVKAEQHKVKQAISDPKVDMVEFEQNKIKGAIRTDFILSAEIIVIALGTVATASLYNRILVVVIIAALMTIFVYGLVAGIVKLDDAGLYLQQSQKAVRRKLGEWILRMAPYLMKTLSIVGTAAMFFVGGGIVSHTFHLEKWGQINPEWLSDIPSMNAVIGGLASTLMNGLIGVVAGGLCVGVVVLGKKVLGKRA